MDYSVKDISNAIVRTIELNDSVFGQEVRPDLIAEMVRYQMAKRRAGTASTKSRSEIRGGGRKPYRQKGTGHARQGTIRAPHYRGGGTVFGPKPHSHAVGMPKKARRKALRSALSERAGTGTMVILDALSLEAPKTKAMQGILGTLETGRTTLLVLSADDRNITLSARNLPGVTVMQSEGVNVYDLLRHESFIITEDAVKKLEERLA